MCCMERVVRDSANREVDTTPLAKLYQTVDSDYRGLGTQDDANVVIHRIFQLYDEGPSLVDHSSSELMYRAHVGRFLALFQSKGNVVRHCGNGTSRDVHARCLHRTEKLEDVEYSFKMPLLSLPHGHTNFPMLSWGGAVTQNCSKCVKDTEHWCVTHETVFPKYKILRLGRVKNRFEKNHAEVNVPDEWNYLGYKLRVKSWMCHQGRTPNEGHWFAFRRDANGVTYQLNDHTVSLDEDAKIQNDRKVAAILLECKKM